jgi:hypothetical protein
MYGGKRVYPLSSVLPALMRPSFSGAASLHNVSLHKVNLQDVTVNNKDKQPCIVLIFSQGSGPLIDIFQLLKKFANFFLSLSNTPLFESERKTPSLIPWQPRSPLGIRLGIHLKCTAS